MHTSAKFKGLAQKKAIEDQNERYALRLHLRAQIETLAYPPGVPPNKYIINWLASNENAGIEALENKLKVLELDCKSNSIEEA